MTSRSYPARHTSPNFAAVPVLPFKRLPWYLRQIPLSWKLFCSRQLSDAILHAAGPSRQPRRAIAYEKSGRWFTAEEPFLRAKERTDAGSSAFRHPRSELIAPLPQEVEPAFNNRKLHMRLPWDCITVNGQASDLDG